MINIYLKINPTLRFWIELAVLTFVPCSYKVQAWTIALFMLYKADLELNTEGLRFIFYPLMFYWHLVG